MISNFFCAPRSVGTTDSIIGWGIIGGDEGHGHGGDLNGESGAKKKYKQNGLSISISTPGHGGSQYAGGWGLRSGSFGYGGVGVTVSSAGGGGGLFGGGSSYVLCGGGGGSGYVHSEPRNVIDVPDDILCVLSPTDYIYKYFLRFGESPDESWEKLMTTALNIFKSQEIARKTKAEDATQPYDDPEYYIDTNITDDTSLDDLSDVYLSTLLSTQYTGFRNGHGKVKMTTVCFAPTGDIVTSDTVYEFRQKPYVYKVLFPGLYRFECYGAEGGLSGGLGGYSRGTFIAKEGDIFTINVGESGKSSSKQTYSSGGGGNAQGTSYGNGGGCSSIMYGEQSSWTAFDKRILIAGGGGGGYGGSPDSLPAGSGGSSSSEGGSSGNTVSQNGKLNTGKKLVLISDLTVCRITLKCDTSYDISEDAKANITLYMDGEPITVVPVSIQGGFNTYVNYFYFDTILPENTTPFYAEVMATIDSNVPIIIPYGGLDLYFFTKTRANDPVIAKQDVFNIYNNIYMSAYNLFKMTRIPIPVYKYSSLLSLIDSFSYNLGIYTDKLSFIDKMIALRTQHVIFNYEPEMRRIFIDTLSILFGVSEVEDLTLRPENTLFEDFVTGLIAYYTINSDKIEPLKAEDTSFLDFISSILTGLEKYEKHTSQSYYTILDVITGLSDFYNEYSKKIKSLNMSFEDVINDLKNLVNEEIKKVAHSDLLFTDILINLRDEIEFASKNSSSSEEFIAKYKTVMKLIDDFLFKQEGSQVKRKNSNKLGMTDKYYFHIEGN